MKMFYTLKTTKLFKLIFLSIVFIFGSYVVYLYVLPKAPSTKQLQENYVTLEEHNELLAEKDKTKKLSQQQLQQLKEQETNFATLLDVTELDLIEDILQYRHISDKQKKVIIETIFEECKKYNVNPLIIYSIIHAESSFRPWIEHDQVTIAGQKMRAVGLGGVMWYWWGDKLKEAEIAVHRSELFDAVTNIRATVFIFNELLNTPMHKDANNYYHSAMLKYFGGSYKYYVEAIERKVMEVIRRKLYHS